MRINLGNWTAKNETLATFDLLLLHGLPAGIVEILHYYIYYIIHRLPKTIQLFSTSVL